MMKKLPSGVGNFEELITDNYYYVDKTMYIEKLENFPNKRVMFLRPRKFGKTLFTSMLEYYYDIKTVEKFDTLFSKTYIGKNPTKQKNSYHILKFNFSGIDTDTVETTISGFKREVASSINEFIQRYNLDFYTNFDDEAESILDNLFKAFRIQRPNQKIYVIIDEYDHFANELLGFNVNAFKDMVSKNGKVRKWYEILKKGTETVVERIFITGVAPITLDGLTSGFNISLDITRDIEFNEMMGFTKEELVELMNEQNISEEEQNRILPMMKIHYDGYRFAINAEERMYNSNMTLYFLNEYIRKNDVPERMIDVNIASDYDKIGRMLNLCQGEKKSEILQKTVSGEGIISEITEKFNPAIGFGDNEMVSMLFYLGYLTIDEKVGNYARLNIPNKVMKEIYADYFLKLTKEILNIEINRNYSEMTLETIFEGKIDKIIDLLHEYLTNLSNRDYQRFDEKYVKLIFYCIAMNMTMYFVKSEMEVKREYPDILLIPREIRDNDYYSVMIEFKYLKRDEANKLEQKKQEAREQIQKYSSFEDIKAIKKLNKYIVIAVVDEVYVEKID